MARLFCMSQCGGSGSKSNSDAQPRLSIALITATNTERERHTHKHTQKYTHSSTHTQVHTLKHTLTHTQSPLSLSLLARPRQRWDCNQTKKHKWATKRKYEYLLSQRGRREGKGESRVRGACTPGVAQVLGWHIPCTSSSILPIDAEILHNFLTAFCNVS